MREQARRSSYEGIETILDSLDKAKSRLKANVNFGSGHGAFDPDDKGELGFMTKVIE